MMPTLTTHPPKYHALRGHPSMQAFEDDTDSEKTFLNFLDEESTNVELHTAYSTSSLWKKCTSFSLPFCITLLNVSLLIGSAFCYYQTWYGKSNSGHSSYMNGELKDFSYFSPLTDIVDVPRGTSQINGSLFPASPPPLSVLPPSPAVDAFWESISHVTMFGISSADVKRLGKDPMKAVKLPESLGFPPDRHLAQLDTIHQIHCLNALRKAAYADYYTKKKEEEDILKSGSRKTSHKLDRLHWIHLSHCTSILLQNLMCNANLDVITLNWVRTQEAPFPDFSVNKQCTNFDVIKAWAEKNALDEEVLKKMKRPANTDDYVELPSPIRDIMDAFEEAKTPWDFDWGSI